MTDKAAIREIFEVLLPAKVRARDTEGYAALFTDHAIWSPAGAEVRHGPREIAQGVAAVLADVDIDPTFYADEIEVIGQSGYVFGRSSEIVTPRGGGPATTVYSRELWLFHGHADRWKIYRMIWNFVPPDQPVP
jgi:uncharacterized protein (TIGR02246 family)